MIGSAVREDFDPRRSDVDFLVEFDRPLRGGFKNDYFVLWHLLEELLTRRVDLLMPDGLKNVSLKQIIEDERKELYVAAQDDCLSAGYSSRDGFAA